MARDNLYYEREIKVPDLIQYKTPELAEAAEDYCKIEKLHFQWYRQKEQEFSKKEFRSGKEIAVLEISALSQENEEEEEPEVESTYSSSFDNNVRLSSSSESAAEDDL